MQPRRWIPKESVGGAVSFASGFIAMAEKRRCPHCGQALTDADRKSNTCPACGREIKPLPVKRDPRTNVPVANERVKPL